MRNALALILYRVQIPRLRYAALGMTYEKLRKISDSLCLSNLLFSIYYLLLFIPLWPLCTLWLTLNCVRSCPFVVNYCI